MVKPAFNDVAAANREIRRQNLAMIRLTNAVMLHLADLDDAVQARRDIPGDVSGWLARWANSLDMANDSARYGNHVDFRTDDKAKSIQKLRKVKP